jgi:AraC-like DNA-binding protein
MTDRDPGPLGASACRVSEDAPHPREDGTGRLLRQVGFSTEALDPRHRFDAWCAEFGGLNDIALPRDERAQFQARFAAWHLGAFTVTSSTTPAMRMLRGPRHVARDGLDHWVLRVARSGTVRSRLGDARHESGARQPVFYSVADGFEGDWTAAEWMTLWVPRDALPGLSAGLSVVPPGPRSGAPAGLLADLLLALPEHLARATAAEAPALAEAIRSMISACLLGDGTPRRAAAPEAEQSGNPLLRERVRRVIRENIRSPRLTPERIARAAGLSRSALYRMLEAEGGVARHIQRVRLGLVHAALSDPAAATRPIAAVAEAHGFHDASSFSRVFRRTYGCAPGDVRAAALLGRPVPAPAGGARPGGAGGLAGLLRGGG